MAGSQFYIQVYNGLISPKHRKAMGEAIWLYLWCLDHQTGPDGKVLRGEAVPSGQVSEDLGISRATFSRWLVRLSGKYLKVEGVPFRGYRLTILKPKRIYSDKRQKCQASDMTLDKSDTHRASEMKHSSVKSEYRHIRNTRQLDNKTAKAVARALVDKWNSTQTLPEIRTMSDSRMAKLKTRLKDPIFAENWPEAIEALSKSPHHIGQNDRGWIADVDWFLRDGSNWLKVWEKYKARRRPVGKGPDRAVEGVKHDLEEAKKDAVPPSPEFLAMMETLGRKPTVDEIGQRPARPFLPITTGASRDALAAIRGLLDRSGLNPFYIRRSDGRHGFEVDDMKKAKAALQGEAIEKEVGNGLG